MEDIVYAEIQRRKNSVSSVCTLESFPAVSIQNLSIRLIEGPPIVKNFCMVVPKGIIYGLLGSSGCGKTTLLSCIAGLRKWNSGEVLVFGKTPGSKDSGIPGRQLGYMPQDLPLYRYLSIKEMLEFYGVLYGMSKKEIAASIEILDDLLKLPASSSLIKNLSGGQQRRVSLALALIHSPDLLILDEPTVGLDPLLRHNIWNYLRKIITSRGTTIIITTHYIEEARLSDKVGVMRNGRLLVEESPTVLMKSYGYDLLEEVIVQLCRKDKTNSNCDQKLKFGHYGSSAYKSDNCEPLHYIQTGSQNDLSSILPTLSQPSKICYSLNSTFTKPNRLSTCYKHFWNVHDFTKVMLLTYLRFPAFLLFILFMPTLHGSLTVLVIGSKMRDMHVGVVNHELGNWTQECFLPKYASNSCDFTALSCKYLNELKTDGLIVLDAYDTEEQARQQVHLGNNWGYLIFRQNYSQQTLQRIASKFYASRETIEGSEIRGYFDNSHFIANFYLQRRLYEAYLEYIKLMARSCKLNAKELDLPLHYRQPVYGGNDDDFAFILPPSMLSAYEALIIILTALTFVTDFKQGTFTRTRVAGLSRFDFLTSHFITQQIVTASQIIIWSTVLRFGFNFEIRGSYINYIAICLLLGIFSTALGLLTGIVLQDEIQCLAVGVFITPIMLLLGGLIFTTHYMSKPWQQFANLLPTNLPAEALRSVMLRGVGLTHSLVWPGIVVLLSWTAAGLILTIFAYRKFCQ